MANIWFSNYEKVVDKLEGTIAWKMLFIWKEFVKQNPRGAFYVLQRDFCTQFL